MPFVENTLSFLVPLTVSAPISAFSTYLVHKHILVIQATLDFYNIFSK